ncbi:MAG: hypothetical protein VYA69_12600 [Gemmatimonadota bacterium]|nr:hypothetical protein [Gemmatimonadota bacterium]
MHIVYPVARYRERNRFSVIGSIRGKSDRISSLWSKGFSVRIMLHYREFKSESTTTNAGDTTAGARSDPIMVPTSRHHNSKHALGHIRHPLSYTTA